MYLPRYLIGKETPGLHIPKVPLGRSVGKVGKVGKVGTVCSYTVTDLHI